MNPAPHAAAALIAAAPHSEQVTHWPERIGWTVGLVLVVVLVYWLMRQGWKWRATLQADLPPLPAVPGDPGEPLLRTAGRYHGTTTAGQWLDRIVAHGLGTGGLAELTLTERGLAVRRTGAEDFFVPAAALRGARTDSGVAGKVVPAGLLVVTWEHGTRRLDSGFRADHPDQHPAWVAAIDRIAAAAPSTTTEGTP